MRSAFLILLMVFSVRAEDGGIPRDYGCPQADLLVRVDGGYYMSDARAKRIACVLAATETERDLLRTQPPPSSGALAALLTLIALGATALGFGIGRLTK